METTATPIADLPSLDHLDIKIETGNIGPLHDPYGSTRIWVSNSTTDKRGEYYYDGLGTNRLKLFDSQDWESPWLTSSWRDPAGFTGNEPKQRAHQRARDQAFESFQAHVGITIHEAVLEYNRRESKNLEPSIFM